jgi:hypothetical protein
VQAGTNIEAGNPAQTEATFWRQTIRDIRFRVGGSEQEAWVIFFASTTRWF